MTSETAASVTARALRTIEDGAHHNKTLAMMASEVLLNNVQHGWRPDLSKTFVEELMLIVSEVSEACDAYREAGLEDQTDANNTDALKLPKPEGVGSELADVLIRTIDTAYWHGIDLGAEYERKMAYNRTRPYRHGGKKL